MLRLCLLAAVVAVGAATYYPYTSSISASSSSRVFAGVDLRRYWQPRYCAPIRLRYPDISDLTCYYIVYYYVHQPASPFIGHLSLPGISQWSSVPQQYWIQYLSMLVDLFPPVFYTPKPFYTSLVSHIRTYYPSIMYSSLYYDHLALTDAYFCRNLVAPRSWDLFKPFYNSHILRLGKSYSSRALFPGLPTIVSNLKKYRFASTVPFLRGARIKPMIAGSTKLVYPHQPIVKRGSLWFPRKTLFGLYDYLKKRNYPWRRWSKQIKKITTYKRIKWGTNYQGLVCTPRYAHLQFLCPAWNHGLLPVFRLRFASYPKRIIYSQKITFQSFLRGFLYQWRPRVRVYSQSLVTSALLAFDNYACGWLGVHFRKQYSYCQPSKLWYPSFHYGGCKSYKC